MSSLPAQPMLPIDQIVVGQRIRTDLGDIDELAATIKQVGMILEPILVGPDNKLLAGGRRLAAGKRAGLNEVPVRYIDGPDPDIVEIIENNARKDWTLGEKEVAAQKLEAIIGSQQGKHAFTPANPEAFAKLPAELQKALTPAPAVKDAAGNVIKPAEQVREVVARAVGFGSHQSRAFAKTVLADPKLAEAVNNGSKTLKAAALSLAPAKPKPPAKKKAHSRPVEDLKAPPAHEKQYYDNVEPAHLRLPLNAKLQDVFNDDLLPEMIHMLRKAAERLSNVGNWNKYLSVNKTITGIELAIINLDNALPHAVCRNCQGNGCDQCHGKGWWNLAKFTDWVEEQKALNPEALCGEPDAEADAQADAAALEACELDSFEEIPLE